MFERFNLSEKPIIKSKNYKLKTEGTMIKWDIHFLTTVVWCVLWMLSRIGEGFWICNKDYQIIQLKWEFFYPLWCLLLNVQFDIWKSSINFSDLFFLTNQTLPFFYCWLLSLNDDFLSRLTKYLTIWQESFSFFTYSEETLAW